MSYSSLNTLPLDGIRPILSYLDLESLIKLFATFDRKIQVLLSSPNAFAYLRLEPVSSSMPRTAYRYFVSSIRNVTHLELAKCVYWSPSSITLLLTLNPRHLEVGYGMLHRSVFEMLRDAKNFPSNEVLRSMAQNFDPNGIPNFLLLTPCLESLMLSATTFLGLQHLQVPSCLTKFKAPLRASLEAILQLPPHLTYLKLRDFHPLEKLFDRFTKLESLTIAWGGCYPQSALRIPPNLDFVKLSGADPLFLNESPENASSWSQSSVSNMDLCFDPLNWENSVNWFPPNLSTLCLRSAKSEFCGTVSLPPTLTSLTASVLLIPPLPELAFNGTLPRRLEHLTLLGNSEAVTFSSFGTLPKTLKSISLKHMPRTVEAIQSMPKTLKSCSVRMFKLEHAEAVFSHFNDCHLSITDEISPWDVPKRVMDATGHWLPQLDPVQLDIALHRYYASLNIELSFTWCFHRSMEDSTFESNLGLPTKEKGDVQVAQFRLQLDSVVLSEVWYVPCLSLFPSGLTSLTSNVEMRLDSWPFTNLERLNAPRTRINSEFWPYLANLTELKAIITDIADFNVVPFLTKLLSRKTRANATIVLQTYVTGGLIPDDDVNGMKHVTWPLIVETTESILRRLLASPMPALDPSTLRETNDGYFMDPVGRIVEKLCITDAQKVQPFILLPASATTAIIQPPKFWSPAPLWVTLSSPREDGVRLPSLTATIPAPLPNRLVRLELHHVSTPCSLKLPETLCYLIVASSPDFHADQSPQLWPSKLEVLIVWESSLNIHDPPSSLQHLAIGLHVELRTKTGSNLHLPHLKTVHACTPSTSSLPLLPIKQLESCVISSPDSNEDWIKDINPELLALITVVPILTLEKAKSSIDAHYTTADPLSISISDIEPPASHEDVLTPTRPIVP